MTTYHLLITLPVGEWHSKISSELINLGYTVGSWLDTKKTCVKGTLSDVIALNVGRVSLDFKEFSNLIEEMLNRLEISFFSIFVADAKFLRIFIAPSSTPLDQLPPQPTYDLSGLN